METGVRRIIGVEIIIADEGKALESSYGHALARLVDNDGLWANDVVISFAANIEGKTINPVSGIMGGYKVSRKIRSMHEFWKQYTQDSNRSLTRYPINLSPTELESVLKTLEFYIRNPIKLGNYKFITNNCVSILTKIFSEAGVVANQDDLQYIPRSANQWIDENLVSAFAPLRSKSFKEARALLATLPSVSLEAIMEKLDLQELAFVYLNNSDMSFETTVELGKYLASRNVDLDRVYGLAPLPSILYSKDFNPKFIRAESKFFKDDVRRNYLRRFTFFNDRRKIGSPLNETLEEPFIPSFFEIQKLLSVKRESGERLVKFKLSPDGETFRVQIAFKRAGAFLKRSKAFQVNGLMGSLKRLGKNTYQLGSRSMLKLIERDDSVDIYLFQ